MITLTMKTLCTCKLKRFRNRTAKKTTCLLAIVLGATIAGISVLYNHGTEDDILSDILPSHLHDDWNGYCTHKGDNLSAAEKSSNATSVGTDITKSSVPSTNPAASVRILCFVTTSPKTAPTRLQAVKDTWSKRCDKMLFFSSVNDSKQSIIGLTVTEGYQQLWGKTKAAFMYIYQYHLDDADWFLKADDDTYVVLDNLRLMLEQYKSPTPVYFGHHLRRPKTNQSFMSGGAGYVLNKVGLTKLVKQGICNNTCQPGEKGAEDVLLGQCLERIGVVRGDSRDELGKQRFVLSSLDNYFKTKLPKWIKAHEHFQYTTGKECCSDSLITVHGVTSDEMYLLDYLIYKVGSLLATHH